MSASGPSGPLVYVLRLSLRCCLVSLQLCDNLRERAALFALLCVMFSCVFVTFPSGVSGWVLIVSIPDICLFLFLILIYGL